MTPELQYTAIELVGTLYMRPELIPVAANVLRTDGLLDGPAGRAWDILKANSANGRLNVARAQVAFERDKEAGAVIKEAQRLVLNPYSYDAEDVAAWATELAEAGYRRVLEGELNHLQRRVNDLSVPLDDVIAEAMQAFSGLRQGGASTWQSLEEAAIEAEELLDQWERGDDLSGVPTGFWSLDDVIHVLPNGELILLAARPSLGKTQLAVQIMFNVARRYRRQNRGECVAIFSAETSGKRLALRIACAHTGVNQMDLKRGRATPEERAKVRAALAEMKGLPFYIDSSPSPTTDNMLVRSLALHNVVMGGRTMRVGLLVFDFIELAGDTADHEEQRISKIARGLKVIAKTLDCPVLALSQLNRRVEERNPPIPQAADLRYCVPGGTLIRLADGRQVRADSLTDGCRVLTLGNDWKLRPSRPIVVWPVGVKQTYVLTTQTGRNVRATANHPFLTPNGWRRLGELEAGDEIAVPRTIPRGTARHYHASEMRLLGYLIGDGGYKNHRNVEFANKDEGVLEDFEWHVRTTLRIEPKRYYNKSRGAWKVSLTGNGTGPGSSPAIEWLKRLGIHGQTAPTKRLPPGAEDSPFIPDLLAGLIATDGCITKGGGFWQVRYDTQSEGLARDVQGLLLRLGVVSYLSVQKQGRYKPLHRVNVTGAKNVARLLRALVRVRMAGKKLAIAERALAECEAAPDATGHMDRLPLAVLDIVAREKERLGLSWERLGYRIQNKRPSRERIALVAETTQSAELYRWANSDILWDRIVSITPGAMEEVLDICVPETENFIANDIIAHNSGMLEQIAYQIFFIYRPAYYVKRGRQLEGYRIDEQGAIVGPANDPTGRLAYVIVAKNKDGDVGMIEMEFYEEHARFHDPREPQGPPRRRNGREPAWGPDVDDVDF